MSNITSGPVLPRPLSEDRRRPKARAPYAMLWLIAVLCLSFALIAMCLQP